MRSSKALFQRCLDTIASADCLSRAAEPLRAIGQELGLARPAVVDDYSNNSLLAAEDGRLLAEIFGWEDFYIEEFFTRKLNRVSPVGQACRIAVKPFVWDAATVTRIVAETYKSVWNVTPERGAVGGITVPIHFPLCRVGDVSWICFDRSVDLNAVIAHHADVLRLAAILFMDHVYQKRVEAVVDPAKAQLTERELECLTWVALGKTDIEIGLIINRSPATARFHVDKAVEKLGASNRTRAVAIAAQLGLIHALG